MHRLRCAWLALGVLAAALVLGACGGGGSESISTTGPPNDSQLALAANTTAGEGSSNVELAVTTQLPSEVSKEPITVKGTGAFDYTSHSGEASFDLSQLFSTLGLPGGDKPVKVVFDGGVLYLNIPFLANLIPGGKSWIKLDPQAIVKIPGLDLSQLQQLGQISPSRALDFLKTTSTDVQEVGTETIRGVETTHYRGTIQLERVADEAPADQQAALRAAMRRLIAQTGAEIPVDVWIDSDGLVRRMSFTYKVDVPVPGSGTQAAKTAVQIDFFDFGTKVDVQPPPPDQVIDLGALAGTSSGAGTETGS